MARIVASLQPCSQVVEQLVSPGSSLQHPDWIGRLSRDSSRIPTLQTQQTPASIQSACGRAFDIKPLTADPHCDSQLAGNMLLKDALARLLCTGMHTTAAVNSCCRHTHQPVNNCCTHTRQLTRRYWQVGRHAVSCNSPRHPKCAFLRFFSGIKCLPSDMNNA